MTQMIVDRTQRFSAKIFAEKSLFDKNVLFEDLIMRIFSNKLDALKALLISDMVVFVPCQSTENFQNDHHFKFQSEILRPRAYAS